MTYVIVTKSDKTGICFLVDKAKNIPMMWSFNIDNAVQFKRQYHAENVVNRLKTVCAPMEFEEAKKLRDYYENIYHKSNS